MGGLSLKLLGLMNHVSVSIWSFDRKLDFKIRNIFFFLFSFFLSFCKRHGFALRPCKLTASHIRTVALIPLLKNNRKTLPLSLSVECLVQQIPISSTTNDTNCQCNYVLIGTVCVGVCCIHHYLFFTSLQALNTAWIQSELEFVKVSFAVWVSTLKSPISHCWSLGSSIRAVRG